MAKCFSITASGDRLCRCFFAFSGLRSVSSDLGDGTVMRCWVPKSPNRTKPNLLLLHGFGANATWQYGDLLRHFVRRFNVYVPDLLFFGGSSATRPERSESFQGRCVMRLMEALGVKKMSLVGISYGGFVGYSMAAEFPEAVEKLAVCCAGVCLEEKDMKDGVFRVPDIEEAARVLLPQTPEKLRELIGFSFAKPVARLPSFFLSDFIHVMCRDHLKEKRELIEAVLRGRQISNIPKIKQPTLVLWGEEDQIFPLELGKRLERHLGENAKLVVIRKAGHAVNLEKAKEFSRHLKEFLLVGHSPPSRPAPPPSISRGPRD